MKDRMERIRSLMEPIERLTITQDAERVVIVDGEGRSERIVPNGKKEQHLIGNTQAELKSAWEDGRLVSEISLGQGLTFKRTIAVETAADGVRRLSIELVPKGGGERGPGGPGGRRGPAKRIYELVE
jgi:hypothetical protein